MKIAQWRERKAMAFAAGTQKHNYDFKYEFEVEFYKKGEEEDRRLREELKRGER